MAEQGPTGQPEQDQPFDATRAAVDNILGNEGPTAVSGSGDPVLDKIDGVLEEVDAAGKAQDSAEHVETETTTTGDEAGGTHANRQEDHSDEQEPDRTLEEVLSNSMFGEARRMVDAAKSGESGQQQEPVVGQEQASEAQLSYEGSGAEVDQDSDEMLELKEIQDYEEVLGNSMFGEARRMVDAAKSGESGQQQGSAVQEQPPETQE